jgi:nucleoside permease NupC
VVFIFIFATAGLLGWAVLKPWVVRWTGWGVERTRREGRYEPLVGEGGREGDGP